MRAMSALGTRPLCGRLRRDRPVPGPARHWTIRLDLDAFRADGAHLARGPVDVLAKRFAEVSVLRKLSVVDRLDEAGFEAVAPLLGRAVSGVEGEHAGVSAELARVRVGSAEDLGPVRGQVLVVPRAEILAEWMVELRVGQTALGGRRGESEEGIVAPGELVDRGSAHRIQSFAGRVSSPA